ncbi:hypothetical protein MBLNU459_g2391t2 [Dothideomycetes sp. NU459]
MATDVIDPEGNIILVVEDARIRVSSTILKRCSRVFRVMLSEHKAEGQNAASDDLVEVYLPDDNPLAMLTMCTLHLRHEDIGARTTSEALLELAIAAAKYDCVSSLKFGLYAWLSTAATTHTTF